MGQLTEFGKELRKIRIEEGLKLMDLAPKLGVSASYISALETGRKPVPPTFVEKLAAVLILDANRRRRLEKAATKTRSTKVSVSLKESSDKSKELAVVFARRFGSLSEKEINKMLGLLKDG